MAKAKIELHKFPELTAEAQTKLVRQLHRNDALGELEDAFGKLGPPLLADLLHVLEFDICRDIFASLIYFLACILILNLP